MYPIRGVELVGLVDRSVDQSIRCCDRRHWRPASLEVKNLKVTYNDVALVLRGLSLTVPDGSIAGVEGLCIDLDQIRRPVCRNWHFA